MRIALIILHADATRGGAERYTLDLAGSLAERGHAPAILAMTFGDLPPGVQPIPIACRGLTRLSQYEHFLSALDAHLAHNPYDVVHAMLPVHHCQVYHPHAGIAADAVCSGHEKYRNPLARALARVVNPFNRKRRRFAEVERTLLTGPKPPFVLCLSSYIQRAVQRHYAIPQDRLVGLLNGADLKRFNPAANPELREKTRRKLGLDSSRVMALMIAQDFARKGLREAIEALARVSDPRLVLTVVGRDTPTPYRRLAEQLGIGDRVIFAGPTTDPVPFYQAADFFVLPTRHDPCSLVVLEALAMGLPVISTVQNGACEVMTPGQEGFVLADPSQVDDLAGAMRSLLDSPTRTRMHQACLTLRPRLSQEEHLRILLNTYGQVQATE